MRAGWPGLLVAVGLGAGGCLANEVVVTSPGTPEDSAPPLDTDPPAQDTAIDTGTAEPEPDFSRWSGSLQFTGETWAGSCDDAVQEQGPLLPASDEAYTVCPACDVIFALDASPARGCDLGGGVSIALPQPTLRGLQLGSGWAAVYNVELIEGELRARLLDSAASLEASELRFTYAESLLGELIEVSGAASFPLVEAAR